MGGAVSAGVDNNHLIDNLLEGGCLRTPHVERIFRAVDRGEYILPEFRCYAYKDQAWRNNHLHMSAPCIYSEVLEGLQLKPGLSFLNLGSGTGYLNTIVGLALGSEGVNHGIEYYQDVIEYAYSKLQDFKKYSGAIDEFDFCEPKFMRGNCLCLTTDRRYDRIYVGATCPEQYMAFVKGLLKVGGILVMPYCENLMHIKRVSETSYVEKSLLAVSFATLILPMDDTAMELVAIEPESLQSLCRSKVRELLRNKVDEEQPSLKTRKHVRKHPPNHKTPSKTDCMTERELAYMALGLRRGGEADSSCDEDDAIGEVDMADGVRVVTDRDIERMDLAAEARRLQAGCSGSGKDCDVVMGGCSPDDAKNRKKMDSGLGEDFPSDGATFHQVDDDDDDDDDEEEEEDEDEIDYSFKYIYACKWRRVDRMGLGVHAGHSSDSGEESDDEPTPMSTDATQRCMVESPYTEHMRAKIDELPLPAILRSYLNYYRP